MGVLGLSSSTLGFPSASVEYKRTQNVKQKINK